MTHESERGDDTVSVQESVSTSVLGFVSRPMSLPVPDRVSHPVSGGLPRVLPHELVV